jgi:hypothetical protein
MDHDWDDDDAAPAPKSEADVAGNRLYLAGFRDGKAKEDEEIFQHNFDQGFEKGARLGALCGELYAEVQHAVKMSSGLLKAEKEDFEQREELVLRFILEKCSNSAMITTDPILIQELENLVKPFPAPVLLVFDDLRAVLESLK